MKLSEISLDETIKFYYEMDESYDNIDSDNKKKDDKKFDEKDKDKVNTKRHLTENEMYMSLAHLLYMKELEFDELNEEKDKKNDNNNKEIKQFTSEKEVLEYVEKIKTRLDKTAINRLYKKVERYFIGDNGAGEKGGLYNRLIENLGLDLRLKESDNFKEKFNKLKLLKQIYIAERIGVYKAGTLREDDFGFMKKISIVDIISSPKLKNMKNKYGDDSICVDEFETIYDNIKSQVEDAEKKEKEIYAIFEQWQKLVNLTFFDTSLSSYSPDKSCRIKEQRDAIKRIPVEFENFVKDKKTEASEAGVIERFFIMLVTARIRAEINDYCKIVFSYSEDETAQPGNSNDMLSLFSAYNITDNNFLKKYVISEFYNTILSSYEFIEILERGSESDKIKLWQLILLRNVDEIPDIRKMEPNVYKYASDAERLNNVAKIWMKEDNKNNFKMALERWCILFRELIFIKITDQGIITTDGRGWGKEKGRHRTLTAIIKSLNPERNVKCSAHKPSESDNKKRKPRTEKEDRREAHSNMALRHRLYNRFLLLYSSPEIVDCINDMVRHILSIAENVFSYDTVKDIKRVNKIMFYIISLYSISYADLSAEEADYNRYRI